MSAQKFAVFDVDGTLVRWQFFHAIVHQLGKSGLIDSATHERIREARRRWKCREHPDAFRDYESTLVHAYFESLSAISEADHQQVIEQVFDEYKDQLFTYTRSLLRALKRKGYLIFAISGSHEAIIEMLADHIGIDDFIGSRFDFVDGKYTGSGSTPIKDKAASLRQLVEKHGATYDASVAVGDSDSDAPMLALVQHAIAFNPSRELFAEAKRNGWRIVIERKNVVYELENRDGTYVLA